MPPRTVAEFTAHGLRVSLDCGSCRGVQVLAADVLDATFGPDFDLVAGRRQIASQLYCPSCGASRPAVVLEAPEAAPVIVEGVGSSGGRDGARPRRRASGGLQAQPPLSGRTVPDVRE